MGCLAGTHSGCSGVSDSSPGSGLGACGGETFCSPNQQQRWVSLLSHFPVIRLMVGSSLRRWQGHWEPWCHTLSTGRRVTAFSVPSSAEQPFSTAPQLILPPSAASPEACCRPGILENALVKEDVLACGVSASREGARRGLGEARMATSEVPPCQVPHEATEGFSQPTRVKFPAAWRPQLELFLYVYKPPWVLNL